MAITRDQVVGKVILEAFNVFKFNGLDGWLDTSDTYLRLENLIILIFERSDAESLSSIDLPKEAERIGPLLEGRKIVEIFRFMSDGEPDIEERILIELDNGLYVTETCVAPHGTGGAGLHFFTKDEIDAHFSDDPPQPFWKVLDSD